MTDAFPSSFLKADDLGGKQVEVTIESVTMEELGQGADKQQKLIIAFRGKDKKLVCNKTNANTIAGLYGDDTDAWVGQKIAIMPRERSCVMIGLSVWPFLISSQKCASS